MLDYDTKFRVSPKKYLGKRVLKDEYEGGRRSEKSRRVVSGSPSIQEFDDGV